MKHVINLVIRTVKYHCFAGCTGNGNGIFAVFIAAVDPELPERRHIAGVAPAERNLTQPRFGAKRCGSRRRGIRADGYGCGFLSIVSRFVNDQICQQRIAGKLILHETIARDGQLVIIR